MRNVTRVLLFILLCGIASENVQGQEADSGQPTITWPRSAHWQADSVVVVTPPIAVGTTFIAFDSVWTEKILSKRDHPAPVIDGSWQLTQNTVSFFEACLDTMKVHLPRWYANGKPEPHDVPVSQFYCELVGVIIQGKKYFYVNAQRHQPSYEVLGTPREFGFSDGGCDFWGALWNPEDGTLSAIDCNYEG